MVRSMAAKATPAEPELAEPNIYPECPKDDMIPACGDDARAVLPPGRPDYRRLPMAEQATDAPRVLPRALTEPTDPVTKGWIGSLGLASLVMWMASITPLQVLIPEQLQNIDPKGKIVALGLVSAFGAVASLLATPIAGALSDRTTHAYGVAHLRGRPQALGLVVGTALVVYAFNGPTAGYLALAIPLVVLTLPFVLATPDHALDPDHRTPLSIRALVASYWLNPRRHPDFAWAWITRFLASLAIGMGTLYLLYFLKDAVHYHRIFPGQTASQGLFILIVIYTGFVIVTAIVGGMISDRIGRRKMIVTISGALMGTAALLLTFVETWTAAMVAAVLFGAGFGAYLAVDQALITQVLPQAKDRAKDLGIINIAIVGPAALAGAIAALLVEVGGYPALFGATAFVAAIGSVLVWKIKSVP